MQTVLMVLNKITNAQIISTNPTIIPRKGDRIDMGYVPAPMVYEVLWKFDSNQTTVTAVVE